MFVKYEHRQKKMIDKIQETNIKTSTYTSSTGPNVVNARSIQLKLYALLVFLAVARAVPWLTSYIRLNFFDLMSSVNQNASTCAITASSCNEYDWKLHAIRDGVATYMSKIPGSKLIGMRGVTVLDTHISNAMGPFVNMTMAFDWVDLLKSIKAYPYNGKDMVEKNKLIERHKNKDKDTYGQDGHVPIDIVHQETNLPWPISPRDIVLKREFHYSQNTQANHKHHKNHKKRDSTNLADTIPDASTVTIKYKSVQDDRIPPQKGYIRADTPHVLWRYTLIPPGVDIYDYLSRSLLVLSNHTASDGASHNKDISPSLQRNAVSLTSSLLDSLEKTYHTSKNHKIISRSFSQPRSNSDSNSNSNSNNKHEHEHIVHISNKPRTIVEIECVFDAKGSIPTWFINFMQQSWPHKTLGKYRKLCDTGKALPFQKIKDWTL